MKIIYSILLSCLLFAGCSWFQGESSYCDESVETLYDCMGGEKVVENVVDAFIMEIVESDQIFPFFEESDVDRFREKFIEHFCYISNGPCEYTGDTMIDVHANMDVNESDFNTTVDLLVNAMDSAGVPHTLQNKMLNRLIGFRKEIIYVER